MIKINDRYYIDSDPYSIAVLERRVVEEGKNKGQEYFTAIAWCGNLIQLKEYLMFQSLKDNIELLNNIEKCIELSHTIDRGIIEYDRTEQHISG